MTKKERKNGAIFCLLRAFVRINPSLEFTCESLRLKQELSAFGNDCGRPAAPRPPPPQRQESNNEKNSSDKDLCHNVDSQGEKELIALLPHSGLPIVLSLV